jgi:hypothetical protein
MENKIDFWSRDIYTWVMVGCGLFVVLTIVAMFTFPGGIAVGSDTIGYSFPRNFLSVLGLTHAPSGESNAVSAILFFIALGSAGAGLVLFSIAYPRLFTCSRATKILGWAGGIFGVISGLCFVGIAFTPADVFNEAHIQFVIWAFRLFPVAAGIFTLAIFSERYYPKRYGVVFLAFTALLVLYYLLLTRGPDTDTPDGLVIQVVGQKVIAYASIISIFIQASGARRLANHMGED